MSYHPRIVETELEDRLEAVGAIVIEGPKACGKTETARQYAGSEVLLDVNQNARRAIQLDPGLVLEGNVPRLIDEWQVEPTIWNHIRRAIDDRRSPGQFILTGSAVPLDDIARHTGAGRLSRLRMRPMSLFETRHSNGGISLSAILDGRLSGGKGRELTVVEIAELIAVGGWPANLGLSMRQKLRSVRDYLNEIQKVDIGRVDDSRRNPGKVGRLLRSLARNVGTHVGAAALAADAGGPDGELTRRTVTEYLDALERLMIVEDQPAWAPHLRSKTRIRGSQKRHFIDPSLAVAAIRATPSRLLDDLNYMGHLFESLVIRDLRVYAQADDAAVLQYHDSTGLEIDAIVEAADGRWAAFEVKLGTGMVDQAAKNLLKFRDRVDTRKCGEPAALAVITGTGYGFVREDGVVVIPIGALGP